VKDYAVKIDDKELAKLLTGQPMRRNLERTGMQVLARAVPKTGIDTGLLRNSMDAQVVRKGNTLELHLGSNVSRPGQGQVEYAIAHWAPSKKRRWAGTRPWTRALKELGITYTNSRGYDV
jgi:hypothetical protein